MGEALLRPPALLIKNLYHSTIPLPCYISHRGHTLMYQVIKIEWLMLYHQVAAERIAHMEFRVRSLNNLKLAAAQVPHHHSTVGPPRYDQSLPQPHPLSSNPFLNTDATLHLLQTF